MENFEYLKRKKRKKMDAPKTLSWRRNTTARLRLKTTIKYIYIAHSSVNISIAK